MAAAAIVLAAGVARASDSDADLAAARLQCGLNWYPAFTFDPGKLYANHDTRVLRYVTIRTARACRYGKLRITVFADETRDGGDLAHERANWLKRLLAEPAWPEDRIEIAIRPLDERPWVTRGHKRFEADARVDFIAPDMAWVRSTGTPPETCMGDSDRETVCKQTGAEPAMPLFDPVMPLGPHTGMVFFARHSSTLSQKAAEVIAEDARKFVAGNFRILMASGFADTSEKDPVALSVRRALALRKELIRQGIDPDAIEIRGLGTHDLLVPTANGVAELQNRRADVSISD